MRRLRRECGKSEVRRVAEGPHFIPNLEVPNRLTNFSTVF